MQLALQLVDLDILRKVLLPLFPVVGGGNVIVVFKPETVPTVIWQPRVVGKRPARKAVICVIIS